MQPTTIRDTGGLRALRSEWDHLVESCSGALLPLSYPWIHTWWHSFGADDEDLHVVTVRGDNGDLLALAPVMKVSARFRRVHVTKLCLMVNGYTPFSGIATRPGVDAAEVCAAVLGELVKEPDVDVVELTRIRAEGELYEAVRAHLRISGDRFGEIPDLETPIIRVDTDWATFLGGLSPRFRKHVRKRLRTLQDGAGFELRRIVLTDRSHPALRDMVEISSRSWKAEVGSDIASDPRGLEFLHALCDAFGPSGDAVAWQLLKDGRPVAFEFQILHGGVAYPLRADHRADFADLSPGAVLEAGMLKALFESPRDTFEYNTCANAYDYLMRWTSTTRRHTSVQVFPQGVVPAALHAFEYRLVPALRPLRSRLRSAAAREDTPTDHKDEGHLRSVREWAGGRTPGDGSNSGKGSASRYGLTRPIARLARYGRDFAGDFLDVAKRQHAFVQVKPNTATLFLTYRCNSRCATCTFWKRPHEEELSREIGTDDWKRIIDQLHDFGVRQVEVFGGNVLLRKRLLIDVLYYLKELGFAIHLPTNQIGLDEDAAQAMVDCCDSVYVSTDGVGTDQDAIRGTKGASELGEAAVTQLRRLRGTNEPPPRIVCNTTVSKYNVDLLDDVMRYAIDREFDEVHFEYAGEHTPAHIRNSIVDGLVPAPYYVQQGGESILVDEEGARQLKNALRRIRREYAGASIGIRSVNIEVLSEKNLFRGTIPHDKCYVERLEVTVDPYGNVVDCPFINNYELGNLVREDLDDVWNNARHRRFREHQNAGDLQMCRHCILGVERNPGLWTSLKRVHLTRLVPLVDRLRSAGASRLASRR